MFNIDESHVGTQAFKDSYVLGIENRLEEAKAMAVEMIGACQDQRGHNCVHHYGNFRCSMLTAFTCPARIFLQKFMTDQNKIQELWES